MRTLYPVLALALLAAVASAWPGPGSPAPNFTAQDTAWQNHQLSDYQGKVVLLNFWQST